MTASLELFSEPFAKTGNMAAEGFKRLLGRPTLDLLQTFVREGIQNILDAGSGKTGPRILIRLRTLSDLQSKTLRERVLAQLPSGDATRSDILASISKEKISVLEICDFNTEGLSGPTGADAAHDAKTSLNFVNFFRNVGAGRDTHQGGGTYGYGKSSLYAMSTCATILADSLSINGARHDRRLMACHLGAAYDATIGRGRRRRFTGRHWWGILDKEDSVEPVTGKSARDIATRLGLPPREGDETGTSIVVVDPFIELDDHQAAADEIVETVLWNFWPRMTGSTPEHQRIRVDVELEGRHVPVPRPEDFPPLDLFAEAMAAHRSKSPECIPIICQRPKKHLGRLMIRKGIRADRIGSALNEDSSIPKQSCHVALMRPIQLVVKYLEGVAFADSRLEWAGVFVCSDDEDIEAAFADSEPPAHDDWIPDNLPKGHGKTVVRVGLARINEIANTYVNPASPLSPGANGQVFTLAATASRMGALLGHTSAAGPGKTPRLSGKGGGGGNGGARPSHGLSRPRSEGLRVLDSGEVVAVFKAEVRTDAAKKNLHIVADPTFVIDGGIADTEDLPQDMRLHVVALTLNGRKSSEGSNFIQIGRESGTVEVLVQIVEGAAIGIRLSLKDGEPT